MLGAAQKADCMRASWVVRCAACGVCACTQDWPEGLAGIVRRASGRSSKPVAAFDPVAEAAKPQVRPPVPTHDRCHHRAGRQARWRASEEHDS
jgi:hypothetical protein